MKLSAVFSLQPGKFKAVSIGDDLERSLRLFKEIGYDGIELAIRNPKEVDVKKLKEIVNRLSLPVVAIGTGQVFVDEGFSFSDSNIEIREKAIERFKEHINLGKELNCPIIIGSIRGQDVDKENLINSLKVCGDFAKGKGVTLLIEPLNRYETNYLNKVSETVEFIKQLGEPFKILLDTFHMNIEEKDILESFRASKNYLGHIHIADSNRLAPGWGHIDFSSIVSYLEEIEYQGFLSAEILFLPNQRSAALQAYKFMKSLLIKGQKEN